MHDGIHLEKAGLPAITICTDKFIQTSHSMAEMWSANSHPILFTQHPIAGLTKSQLAQQTEPLINGIIEGITEER